ncbi:MAG: hypothetical protein CL876_01730 [Dehalococcoidales bacterium]|nr:hypothetical protein [Dehalococcoidales bacterium]
MADDKKPTELLKDEHQGVLQKLAALQRVIGQLDNKDEISAELKELAEFFKTEFWIHFTKEEEALFPEIGTFIPRESGPTGMMLVEHEELRSTNTVIQQAVDAYLRNSGGSDVKGTIQENGNRFIEVLRQHIDKEDNILFMMADMHFDQAQIDKVARLFHEIETR